MEKSKLDWSLRVFWLVVSGAIISLLVVLLPAMRSSSKLRFEFAGAAITTERASQSLDTTIKQIEAARMLALDHTDPPSIEQIIGNLDAGLRSLGVTQKQLDAQRKRFENISSYGYDNYDRTSTKDGEGFDWGSFGYTQITPTPTPHK